MLVISSIKIIKFNLITRLVHSINPNFCFQSQSLSLTCLMKIIIYPPMGINGCIPFIIFQTLKEKRGCHVFFLLHQVLKFKFKMHTMYQNQMQYKFIIKFMVVIYVYIIKINYDSTINQNSLKKYPPKIHCLI